MFTKLYKSMADVSDRHNDYKRIHIYIQTNTHTHTTFVVCVVMLLLTILRTASVIAEKLFPFCIGIFLKNW